MTSGQSVTVVDANGLCVWCEISPTKLSVCSLGSSGAGLSVTGPPAAPAEQKNTVSGTVLE